MIWNIIHQKILKISIFQSLPSVSYLQNNGKSMKKQQLDGRGYKRMQGI